MAARRHRGAAVLARWSGWGAVPEVFDDRPRGVRLGPRRARRPADARRSWRPRARTTLNAHYTDAALAQAIWDGVQQLGFTGGRVLEPGCGSGNFIGFAPAGAQVTGVELEPVTAADRRRAVPARARSSPSRSPRPATRDGSVRPGDRQRAVRAASRCTTAGTTPAGHSIHNHFIIKSLHLTRPGGLVMVLTSRYTMDARNPAARREIAALRRPGRGGPAAQRRAPAGRRHRAWSPTCWSCAAASPAASPDPTALGAGPADRARRRAGRRSTSTSSPTPRRCSASWAPSSGAYRADDLVVARDRRHRRGPGRAPWPASPAAPRPAA